MRGRTELVTGPPDATLDGVYKLAFANGSPRIKFSKNVTKITLPHHKQVFRMLENDGNFIGADVVTLADENNVEVMYHPMYPLKSLAVKKFHKEALLQKVMENGIRVYKPHSLNEIEQYSLGHLKNPALEYKRFNNPHIYKVGLSDRLMNERDQLIEKIKNKIQ